MPIQRNRARATRRAVVASLLFALLAACASTKPARPQRTYDHIAEPSVLYSSTEAVLKSAGYGIAKRDLNRLELQTSWKESDGEQRGPVRWRERRQYHAWFEVESLQERYDFFLELSVQERPPGATAWTDKKVVPEQDAEYVRILQEMDATVKKIGGVRY